MSIMDRLAEMRCNTENGSKTIYEYMNELYSMRIISDSQASAFYTLHVRLRLLVFLDNVI